SPARARHARIPLPKALYGAERPNSAGVELGSRAALAGLQAEIAAGRRPVAAASLIAGKPGAGTRRAVLSPIDGSVVGEVTEADEAAAQAAMQAAAAGFHAWDRTDVAVRAAALDKAAALLEAR